MQLIKIIIGKLGAGILYGAGFFIGLALIGSVAIPYFKEQAEKDADERMSSMFIEYDESAKLEATVTSEKIKEGEFTLVGHLSNGGDESWSSVSLKAEIYDKSGAFIDECEEYIRQTSRPGKDVNFKLSCGSSCSPFDFSDYGSYKLMVIDASHKR